MLCYKKAKNSCSKTAECTARQHRCGLVCVCAGRWGYHVLVQSDGARAQVSTTQTRSGITTEHRVQAQQEHLSTLDAQPTTQTSDKTNTKTLHPATPHKTNHLCCTQLAFSNCGLSCLLSAKKEEEEEEEKARKKPVSNQPSTRDATPSAPSLAPVGLEAVCFWWRAVR
eukprot:416817-Rhodomonas_salina.1